MKEKTARQIANEQQSNPTKWETTNQFIESQQGEYGEWDIEIDGVKYAGKRAIQQIIKNTGEELMRLAEGEQRDIEVRLLSEGVSRDRIQQMDKYQAIDTLKQHIASVTGVE